MDLSGLPRLPDPGTPVNPDATTAPAVDGGQFARVEQFIADIPDWAILVATIAASLIGAAVAAWAITALIRRLRGVPRVPGSWFRKAMVFVAAAVGSSFTVYSMWRVFEHQLHIDNPYLRGVLCGIFEIVMLASALNSRAMRIQFAADQAAGQGASDDKRPVDADGIVAWGTALISGVFCAADSTTFVEGGIRFLLPLIVVWMWERAIAADLRKFQRTTRKRKINLRVDQERVLVALRIADPTDRGVDEVDRARCRNAFTVAAYRLHIRKADGAGAYRVALARWRLRRAGLAIMSRYGVAELTAARADVAALYDIEDSTAPGAVEHLAPWMEHRRPPLSVESTVEAANPGDSHPPVALRTPGTLAGVRTEIAAASAGGSSGANPGANPGATGGARVAEKVAAKPVAVPRAKPTANPVESFPPLGSEARKTVDRLARAYARKPEATNLELAKLAKVSLGSANRHMPRVRAEAAAAQAESDVAENGGRESSSAVPAAPVANLLPIVAAHSLPLPAPTAPVMSGTNGHHVPEGDAR